MRNWHTVILFCIVGLAFFLRVYKLGSVPPSLHGDEVGVGYNAYSLLVSGKDEYGNPWPLVFRADVPPLIFYATLPAINWLGLTEFAVRFPSVLVGTLTVSAVFSLSYNLLLLTGLGQKFGRKFIIQTGLITALFLSISPWHIQISRIAHDASYGLLLQVLAIACFSKYFLTYKPRYFLVGSIFFASTFYAYHSPRLTSPLLLILLIFVWRDRLKSHKFTLFSGFGLFLVIVAPIILEMFATPLSQTRFGGINIFIGERLSWISVVTLPIKFIGNFLAQFHPWYLFVDSSSLRYLQTYQSGLLYLWQLPFLLFGFWYLFRFRKLFWFLLIWIIISVLPGALTQGIINGGRILAVVVAFQFVIAIGVIFFLSYISRLNKLWKKVTRLILVAIWFLSITVFLHQYFVASPSRFASQWQAGLKEIALFVTAYENQYDKIVISNSLKQAYIYILFYGQKSPQWLAVLPNQKRHRFIGYTELGKYEFRALDLVNDRKMPNAILVGTAAEIPDTEAVLFEVKQNPYQILRVVKT